MTKYVETPVKFNEIILKYFKNNFLIKYILWKIEPCHKKLYFHEKDLIIFQFANRVALLLPS